MPEQKKGIYKTQAIWNLHINIGEQYSGALTSIFQKVHLNPCSRKDMLKYLYGVHIKHLGGCICSLLSHERDKRSPAALLLTGPVHFAPHNTGVLDNILQIQSHFK